MEAGWVGEWVGGWVVEGRGDDDHVVGVAGLRHLLDEEVPGVGGWVGGWVRSWEDGGDPGGSNELLWRLAGWVGGWRR